MHSGAKYCCKAVENEDRKEAVGFGKMKAASDLGRVVSGLWELRPVRVDSGENGGDGAEREDRLF